MGGGNNDMFDRFHVADPAVAADLHGRQHMETHARSHTVHIANFGP